MEILDSAELWRRIPPEEKFELMSRAQAKGVSAALSLIVVAGTCAVGFRTNLIFWVSFLLAPLVFQLAAGRAWRRIRPMVMLEYLAARSAARRYAFTAGGKELTVTMIFRGTLERHLRHHDEELDEREGRKEITKVWISLFPDSLVIMSEGTRGANLEYCQLLKERCQIEGEQVGRGQYEVRIVKGDSSTNIETSIILRSKHPGALLVFSKKLQEFHQECVRQQQEFFKSLSKADDDW